MHTPDSDRAVFQLAYNFLLNIISDEVIDKYITTPNANRPPDMKRIYRQLAISAQNAQIMSGVIGKSIGGIDKLNPILFDFDVRQVVRHYELNDSQLLDVIKEQLKPGGKLRTTTRSKWPQYCRALLDGAAFLNRFESAEDFYQWVDFFDHDERTRAALPLLLTQEIRGIGFALACDFIKELGFMNFGKPDVHIREIFGGLGLAKSRGDYHLFQALQRVAQSVNRTPFAVDKVFWLIGSRELSHINRGFRKEDFIAFAKTQL